MEDWKQALPEDIRENPALKDFKDPVALAKSYLETKSLVGASLRPPGPDASPEAKEEFARKLREKVPDLVPRSDEKALWEALGKPSKPDDYVPGEGDVPAGVNLDMGALRKAATELGLTKGQFRALVAASAKMAEESLGAHQKESAALKAEWGAAHPEKVLAAQAAAQRAGMSAQEATSLSPSQLRYWANVSAGNASGVPIRNQEGQGTPTPAEAKEALAEIRANPGYFDTRHPDHQRLKDRAARLIPLAFRE